MLLSQRTRRCRELTGPTPHSVAVRAKFPSSKPLDYLIRERQKQDAIRDKALEFSKHQQMWNIKTTWLKSSEDSFLRGTIERGVQAALSQQEVQIQEKRDRLRVMLETEEQQLLQEIEEKMETSVERQAKMRERAKTLRDKRERERQQLVTDKLEQLFREQCEELRSAQSRTMEKQVCSDRLFQVRTRKEQLQLQQQEEKMFDELWEADWRAKEEKEAQRVQRLQQSNMQQHDFIKSQMEAAKQQKQKDRELREEEAKLMSQQREMHQLQQQREQQQRLQDQLTRRRQLDRTLRLKMKRLAREQQDELQQDIDILQKLLIQETDEKQEAAQRKAELREEQQRYRQYLSGELQMQKRLEEETEQLREEKLKEVWTKREEQSRLQREARNRLMKEAMDAQSLQIQYKLDMNMQKQAELSKERDELNRVIEEIKQMNEEETRRQKQTREAYQADLRAQMKERQQLQCEQKQEAERVYQEGLIQEELYKKRKEEILSRPTSHTIACHPFRRAEGSRSAATRRQPAHGGQM